MKKIEILLICLGVPSFFEGSFCSTLSSPEHHIRADLLLNYDKKVRPVISGRKHVDVEFAMRISRLVRVDTQEQLVVLDTWIIQKWKNEFLQWNISDYKNIGRVHFSPNEIWVPDIALFNNGDDQINLAGGPGKFVTDVSVKHDGECSWSSPATFKVNCEMQVDDWPFDEQNCTIAFGSYTYGENLLRIKSFKDKSQFTNRFVESGNWEVLEPTFEITETDHGECCQFNFSEAVYTVRMRRKALYYTFYLTIPCIILTVLSLSSFLIRVESGERIGFVTTVLLSMTVFLLMIPSFLPVTSDGVPVLGVLLQGTMIIITLVLFANILTQWIYYREESPPEWIQSLCWFFGRRKGQKPQRIHVAEADHFQPALVKSAATIGGIEMMESNRSTPVPNAHEEKPEPNPYTWQKVSIKMDRMFFILFLFTCIISYGLYIGVSL